MQERYQESQARFEAIFEQSKLGNKIIASDLRIIKVNQALVVMLGYSKAQLEGNRILEYEHPDYVHHWRELQEDLRDKQIPSFQVETVLVKKDGSTLWCRVTSILFQDAGATLGYTILEDISQRKALEEKLQKVYEAQETIMYMVAHDLKSPIHTIKSLSGLLKRSEEELQPENPQHQQSLTFVSMIEDACRKAYTIIDDLLLIGELESGKQTLTKESTDLKGFLEAQLAPVQITAQGKNIAIHLHLPLEQVFAPVNPEKLARVLENLLSNAVKFTQAGGQVNLSLQQEGQKVLFKVQDNGIGIPDSLQGSVFKKFTKANRQGTEGEATTGLGLFIVKQIVDLHRGRIWLESKEHEGTTFYIELPVA